MCYGLSKMSVINDFQDSLGYKKLEFVEFLEFICRIAHEKYKPKIYDSVFLEQQEDLQIYEKLERLLDLILLHPRREM